MIIALFAVQCRVLCTALLRYALFHSRNTAKTNDTYSDCFNPGYFIVIFTFMYTIPIIAEAPRRAITSRVGVSVFG